MLKSELKLIWQHTLTVLTGQLAAVLAGVVDTVVAGRYSDDALAALSVASALNISVTVGFIGVLNVLLPIYAEHRGAGRPQEVGKTLHQGLYLAALLGLLAVLVLNSCGSLLELAKVPPNLIPPIEQFLAIQSLVIPIFMLFRMYAALNQALGKPWFVTWLQVAILLLKIPLTYWFVSLFGLVGCAYASLLVGSSAMLFALHLVATHADYKPYAIWRKLDAPNRVAIVSHLKLGLPAGLSQLVEITSFTLISLLVARLGVVASAAHQIASTVAALVFMLPISYGVAATARVSYWLGHGNPKLAAQLVKQILTWGFAFGCVLGAIVLLTRHIIASHFSTNADVIALASTLLAFVAFYHVPDGLQIMGMFMLRCYKITLLPLVVYTVFLWGIGLGGGYWLAYGNELSWLAPFVQSPSTFWLTAIISLGIVSIWFCLALIDASKKACQPKL
jgi:multidrug resistance protein, MATE family